MNNKIRYILFIGLFIVTYFLSTIFCLAQDELNVQRVTTGGGLDNNSFGCSVSATKNYAIIGAPYDHDNGEFSGAAYIFELSGGSWLQAAKLTADDGSNRDYFGRKVSITNNYAIVGAPSDDDNGHDSGSAYIFKRIRGIWTQEAKLTASDAGVGNLFGSSVSIHKNYAIIGAYYSNNGERPGSAYIFKYRGGSWIQTAKLTAKDEDVGNCNGPGLQ